MKCDAAWGQGTATGRWRGAGAFFFNGFQLRSKEQLQQNIRSLSEHDGNTMDVRSHVGANKHSHGPGGHLGPLPTSLLLLNTVTPGVIGNDS